jgi:hypothetical protein
MKNILKDATMIVAVAVLIISVGGGYHQAAGSPQEVEISPGMGLEFFQLDLTFPEAPQKNSPFGLAVVDFIEMTESTGITWGYLNILTENGWVVRNMPVYPMGGYLGMSIIFDLGHSGDINYVLAYAIFSSEPTVEFTGTPTTLFDVGELSYNAEGRDEERTSIPRQLVNVSMIQFIFGGRTSITWQPGHPSIEQDIGQCGPASVANCFQWLENCYGINIPHQHRPGIRDDSLVGELDKPMQRQQGCGVTDQSFLGGKLSYIDRNNLSSKLNVKHKNRSGTNFLPNTNVTVGNATSRVDTNANVSLIDWIITELENDEDVELAIGWDDSGGHWVNLIGGGYILGVPWISWVHDAKQGENNGTNWYDGGIGFSFVVDNRIVCYLEGTFSTATIDCAVSESPQRGIYETIDLNDLTGDDDIDVYGIFAPVSATAGQKIEWDYTYTKGGPQYEVRSNDLADIEELRLYGPAVSGTMVDVELWFFDCNKRRITPKYRWNGVTWRNCNVLISDGFIISENDVLGNLQNKCIAGFHLEITVTAGAICLNRINFYWEAWDIEAISCVCGDDPPIYENIMIFPTKEHHLGSDLNGDGDINDTILRYQDLKTGQVINTTFIVSGAHHAIDIYEDIIAFIGKGSHIYCYDINTNTVSEIGATGSRLSVYEDTIAFSSKGTIHYFDLKTQTLVDTRVFGYNPAIYHDMIVFHAFSPKPTIWIYDLNTEVAVNTGIIGMNPTLYETIIAFTTSEISVAEDLNGDGDTRDLAIRCYDLESQTIINTGEVGYYPAIHGNRIAFTTPERNVNQDLNGDGRILAEVIRYYDLESNCVVNTRQLGSEPDIYEDIITFYLWERWIGQDLNGDSDQSDPIVETYRITMTEMSIKSLEPWLFFVLLLIGGITAYFKKK